MALLLEALNLPASYNGRIRFLFGQNFGFRQPVIGDPSTKRRLVPELKILMEPLLDYPELGGTVDLHFHDGVVTKVVIQSCSPPRTNTRLLLLDKRAFMATMLRVSGRDWFNVLKQNQSQKASDLLGEFNDRKGKLKKYE